MTTHYDTSRSKTPLCDGDHEWGEPFLDKGNTKVVLEDGEPHLKITWVVQKPCTNDNTVNTNNVYSTCQKNKLVDRGSRLVPVSEL